MKNSFKGKKILITAGPTWVPVDSVRVISNISTGELGILLAQKATALGMETDLFLGPTGQFALEKKMKIFKFVYFKDLLDLVKRQLKTKRYDIILHCAAVSDYLTEKFKGKISSKRDNLVLKLRRAPKIIKTVRQLNPEAFLVMFKLEADVSNGVLLKRSVQAMKECDADLVVANTFDQGKYKGYILNGSGFVCRSRSKRELAERLFEVIKEKMFKDATCLSMWR